MWLNLLLALVMLFGSSDADVRNKRGIITTGTKLLKNAGKTIIKQGNILRKLWEVKRMLLNGAKLHARQFGVDHYVKLGNMDRARDDFFAIRNRLSDIKIERSEHEDVVTLITRVGDREVKLKMDYNDKSSTLTFLRPGTPDKREVGIVIHYCKLDRSTLC